MNFHASKSFISRICLGTAQFGFKYGVANEGQRMPEAEAARLLDAAREVGIFTLDTAIAYGESEEILGRIGLKGFHVSSKLPAMPRDAMPSSWVEDCVSASLKRLGLPQLSGLLLHRASDLRGPYGPAIYKAMHLEKARGRVARIGVSIYSPEELDALPEAMHVDVVQAPFNPLDQRIVQSGWRERLLAAGAQIEARSLFLQGLLLMPAEKRPAYFAPFAQKLAQWDEAVARSGLSALAVCIGFARFTPGISRFVIGVDSLGHLKQILTSAQSLPPHLPDDIASDQAGLINPSLWKFA